MPGWVMSDWGAVHALGSRPRASTRSPARSSTQQVFFDEPLRRRPERPGLSPARVRGMNRRILRGMFAAGLFDTPSDEGLDRFRRRTRARCGKVAEEAIVVLRERACDVADCRRGTKRIAVIGGYAEFGVISGGGARRS